jgi:large subunit ribosomal protein L13
MIMTSKSEVYKTKPVDLKSIHKKWYIVDATDQYVGRLASQVALILRGKNKPDYTPFLNCGDNVIIVNASNVKFSGKKYNEKTYIRHTGYPGGQRLTTPKKLSNRGLDHRIIMNAVKGMLPKNRLGRKILTGLRVFNDENHHMEAQKPEVLKLRY